MRAVLLAVVAFAAMEPVTAATHRVVMHGVGIRLHRSHHRRRTSRLEANDLYPVLFAAVVCVGLWVGFHDPATALSDMPVKKQQYHTFRYLLLFLSANF